MNRRAATNVQVLDSEGRSAGMNIEIKEVVLVAMGDSYASGEGSPDRPAIYPKRATPSTNDWFMHSVALSSTPEWLDRDCHRSLLSWPVLAALRVALENPDVVVKLHNVTCSGAEFLDGLFTAQRKKLHDNERLQESRDGDGKRPWFTPQPGDRFLARSQVNAVREQLCHPSNNFEDISVGGFDRVAAVGTCSELRLRPDALMLTAGGNDVHFAKAVMGLLIPHKGRTPLGQWAVNVTRRFSGAIAPTQLTSNLRNLSPYYLDYLDSTVRGAMVQANQTVLIKYPNPIGPPGVSCSSSNERIRDTFMAFGPVLKIKLRGANWVVNIGRDEAEEFTERSYKALMNMQNGVDQAYQPVEWLASNSSFDGRLLCKDQTDEMQKKVQEALEPIYFCSGRECNPKPLATWNFEVPGRRIVNTINDTLLGQRNWRANPSNRQLVEALSGAFHPITEAHAVAADSAYGRLCQVLNPRGIRCAPKTP